MACSVMVNTNSAPCVPYWIADALCWMNDKAEPIPFNKSSGAKGADWDVSQPCTKVAVVVTGYSAHVLGKSKELTGQTAFGLRLLALEGFVPVSIPYAEFSYSEKLVRRVQYLEQKIKNFKSNHPKDT